MVNETSDSPGFVINNIKGTKPVFILHNADYLKDYILNETDLTNKVSIYGGEDTSLGLFYQNGERLFRSRALFSDIFHIEKLGKFTPSIREIVRSTIHKFILENEVTKEIDVDIRIVDFQ